MTTIAKYYQQADLYSDMSEDEYRDAFYDVDGNGSKVAIQFFCPKVLDGSFA